MFHDCQHTHNLDQAYEAQMTLLVFDIILGSFFDVFFPARNFKIHRHLGAPVTASLSLINHTSLVLSDPPCDLKVAGIRSTNKDQWYTKFHVMLCTENIVTYTPNKRASEQNFPWYLQCIKILN
jgi:hypothetical protein